MKTLDLKRREIFQVQELLPIDQNGKQLKQLTAGQAKREGCNLILRADWEQI